MKCPNCEEKIEERWIFCPMCKADLKKECPVCGEQEPITSILCQTKLDEIRKERDEYIELKTRETKKAVGGKTIEIIEVVLTKHILKFFVFVTFLSLFSLFLNFLGTFLVIMVIPFVYIFWLVNKTSEEMKIAKEKAEKEFLEKIPNAEYRDSLVSQKISKIKQEILEKQERYS